MEIKGLMQINKSMIIIMINFKSNIFNLVIKHFRIMLENNELLKIYKRFSIILSSIIT